MLYWSSPSVGVETSCGRVKQSLASQNPKITATLTRFALFNYYNFKFSAVTHISHKNVSNFINKIYNVSSTPRD